MDEMISWNNPNNLTSEGWSNQWCRLCGVVGPSCNTWDDTGRRVVVKNKIRSAYLCDECKKKEEISNGR